MRQSKVKAIRRRLREAGGYRPETDRKMLLGTETKLINWQWHPQSFRAAVQEAKRGS